MSHKKRLIRKSQKHLLTGVGEFLVKHGLAPLTIPASMLNVARQLEKVAELRTDYTTKRLSAKRRIARAMLALQAKYVGKLPLRFTPAIEVVQSNRYMESQDRARRFYQSAAWINLRYQILKKYGPVCQSCHKNTGPMHVDHIKSLRRYWHLRLDPDNLQVLCAGCNWGKGNYDETDHRPREETGIEAWRRRALRRKPYVVAEV